MAQGAAQIMLCPRSDAKPCCLLLYDEQNLNKQKMFSLTKNKESKRFCSTDFFFFQWIEKGLTHSHIQWLENNWNRSVIILMHMLWEQKVQAMIDHIRD